jgi:hypothetical protein
VLSFADAVEHALPALGRTKRPFCRLGPTRVEPRFRIRAYRLLTAACVVAEWTPERWKARLGCAHFVSTGAPTFVSTTGTTLRHGYLGAFTSPALRRPLLPVRLCSSAENFIVLERPCLPISETPQSQTHRCRSQHRNSGPRTNHWAVSGATPETFTPGTLPKPRTDPVGLHYGSERFHSSRLDGLENL